MTPEFHNEFFEREHLDIHAGDFVGDAPALKKMLDDIGVSDPATLALAALEGKNPTRVNAMVSRLVKAGMVANIGPRNEMYKFLKSIDAPMLYYWTRLAGNYVMACWVPKSIGVVWTVFHEMKPEYRDAEDMRDFARDAMAHWDGDAERFANDVRAFMALRRKCGGVDGMLDRIAEEK